LKFGAFFILWVLSESVLLSRGTGLQRSVHSRDFYFYT